MQVGLIGKGYWGKILLPKLEKISNVKFVCGSKDDYKTKLDLVDWVFIATPNDTHYEIVKYCIKKGKNIFCEKPLTPTYDQSKELFKLAEKYNVKLYVNDVFNYRDEKKKLRLNSNNKIKVTWNKKSNNTLYDLLYHDLYLLYPILKEKVDIKNNNKHLIINNITFEYGIFDDRTHLINNINFTHSNNNNDALLEMLLCVLNDTADYKFNKKITLNTNKIIDLINK